ncbi:hypothetical protein J1N35_010179 [Gossypium stocksii]|uniref:Uncharacterized protein n=1 Tax=Gossypium stocksii TaxID=47602 RepID=A0A9D4ACI6_9ROSI|nr:hypothetical protein J1N35_010179 [Gossypium stocksii]
MNKHQISRAKGKICKERVAELVHMTLDDGSYLKGNWDKRIELLDKVIKKLKDPQFLLERLTLLQQSSNTALSQYSVNEIHKAHLNSNQLDQNEVLHLDSNQSGRKEVLFLDDHIFFQILALDRLMWVLYRRFKGYFLNHAKDLFASIRSYEERYRSRKEELEQHQEFLKQAVQSMKYKAVLLLNLKKMMEVITTIVAVVNLDSYDRVGGYFVVNLGTFVRKVKQLIIGLPPAPLHSQAIICQEGQPDEMSLILNLLAERVENLKLPSQETIICQEGQPDEMSLIINLLAERVENLKLPSQETSYPLLMEPDFDLDIPDIPIEDFMDDTCIIHSYKVFKRNGDVLNEIFENYPNIADNFRIIHPDYQSYVMNSLAELYQKIKSEEEMLQQNDITNMLSMIQDEELQDITDMESKLQDLELSGLQLLGLKERLKEVRESKRLLQQINGRKAIENKARREREEAEQQLLAKLQKKRRF